MGKWQKRKKYFIGKEFQKKFIITLLVASLAGSLLSITLFIFLAFRKMDTLLYSMRIPASVFHGNVLFREAFWANSTAVVAVCIAFILATRALFMKITGPLTRIRAEILRFGSGDLSTGIFLREGDGFQDFTEDLNSMGFALQRRFSVMKDLAQHLSELSAELNKPENRENRDLRKKILSTLNALERETAGFKRCAL